MSPSLSPACFAMRSCGQGVDGLSKWLAYFPTAFMAQRFCRHGLCPLFLLAHPPPPPRRCQGSCVPLAWYAVRLAGCHLGPLPHVPVSLSPAGQSSGPPGQRQLLVQRHLVTKRCWIWRGLTSHPWCLPRAASSCWRDSGVLRERGASWGAGACWFLCSLPASF